MLRETSIFLVFRNHIGRTVVSPKARVHRHNRFSSQFNTPYQNMFWRRLTDPEFQQGTYWVSDFKHRYLAAMGRDYRGKIPETPPPGTYTGVIHTKRRAVSGGHPLFDRETRHLPVMPLSARSVYEHRAEKRIDFLAEYSADRRKLVQMREHEFYEWYMKLQRVRGRWCRENGIRSRGVYGPAVDAAEIWG
eukprot:Tbor_TRINITY_DN5773_c4_g2::TRINITY_DN5773_c4_g2_i1::g.20533::m.20533